MKYNQKKDNYENKYWVWNDRSKWVWNDLGVKRPVILCMSSRKTDVLKVCVLIYERYPLLEELNVDFVYGRHFSQHTLGGTDISPMSEISKNYICTWFSYFSTMKRNGAEGCEKIHCEYFSSVWMGLTSHTNPTIFAYFPDGLYVSIEFSSRGQSDTSFCYTVDLAINNKHSYMIITTIIHLQINYSKEFPELVKVFEKLIIVAFADVGGSCIFKWINMHSTVKSFQPFSWKRNLS